MGENIEKQNPDLNDTFDTIDTFDTFMTNRVGGFV